MQCHYFSPVYQLLPVPPLSHTTPELLQALCHCKYPPDFISTKPHNSVILTYNFCFACQLSASSLPLKLSPYYLTSISPVSTHCAEALIDAFLDILEYLYIYMMSIHLDASIFTFSSPTTSLAYFSLAFQTDTKQTAWEIGAHCWADWQALGCWPRHTHMAVRNWVWADCWPNTTSRHGCKPFCGRHMLPLQINCAGLWSQQLCLAENNQCPEKLRGYWFNRNESAQETFGRNQAQTSSTYILSHVIAINTILIQMRKSVRFPSLL